MYIKSHTHVNNQQNVTTKNTTQPWQDTWWDRTQRCGIGCYSQPHTKPGWEWSAASPSSREHKTLLQGSTRSHSLGSTTIITTVIITHNYSPDADEVHARTLISCSCLLPAVTSSWPRPATWLAINDFFSVDYLFGTVLFIFWEWILIGYFLFTNIMI